MSRSPLPSLIVILLTAALAFYAGRSWPARAAAAPAAPSASPARQTAPAPAQNGSRGAIPPQPQPQLQEQEKATIALFQHASPAAVFITSLAVQQNVFSLNETEVPRGSGSGFVWDRQGHIVTNFHVISGADAAKVTLADQSTWDAKLVGAAPEKDLAVLKIDAPASKLTPLPLGSSETLKVGQSVFAIGNPFGLDQSLTTGVVSALGREIQSESGAPIREVIQTDAAINPGNSGGPLLDSSGRLIGVNTAIYSPSGGSAGIGFAIPEHDVAWVVPDLIRYGRVQRPSPGFTVTQGLAQRLGIDGAVISRVQPGSGADRAGLQGLRRARYGRVELGDIVLTVDGQPVTSGDALLVAIEGKKAGDTVRVEVLRGNRRVVVPVQLGAPSARGE
ncbi:MAG: 2-alkenal reductase [Acidobacteria bacterium]|nr:MAG: 2-alkenal reductase [Acidobacteriota bacterium]